MRSVGRPKSFWPYSTGTSIRVLPYITHVIKHLQCGKIFLGPSHLYSGSRSQYSILGKQQLDQIRNGVLLKTVSYCKINNGRITTWWDLISLHGNEITLYILVYHDYQYAANLHSLFKIKRNSSPTNLNQYYLLNYNSV